MNRRYAMAGIVSHLYLGKVLFDKYSKEMLRVRSWRRAFAYKYFLAGCIGPDLWYFPKANKKVSDLLHHEWTADCLRYLLAHARTTKEKAFAYGWACHVIADIVVHPLINAQVKARLEKEKKTFSPTAQEALPLHANVEASYDYELLKRLRYRNSLFLHNFTLRFLPMPPFKQTNLIQKALLSIYGFSMSKQEYRQATTQALWSVQKIPWMFITLKIVKAERWWFKLLKPFVQLLIILPFRVFFYVSKEPLLFSLLQPDTRTPEDYQAYERKLQEVIAIYSLHLKSNFANLPNINLDTGEIIA